MSALESPPLGEHEIYDPAAYRDGIPYDTFASLREHEPVSWHTEHALPHCPEGPGFWAVMRHEDVQFVSRTPQLFSAAIAGTLLRDPAPENLDFTRSMLLNMDPPRHGRYRRIISRTFTREALDGFDHFIGSTAQELVAAVRDEGECDIVRSVTDDLSLRTLAHVLGVPSADRRFFFEWANRVIGYHDDEIAGPEVDATVDPRDPANLEDMFTYADELAEHRRREPGDDLISALVHAEVDGEHLTTAEFRNAFFLLAVAGNDTTRGALPGALLALMDHPDQMRDLREDPSLMRGAVEECLRFAPPVIHFRRTATEDTTLRSVPIRAGEKVVVFYPSANRDPRAFADPDVFDIRRGSSPHVTFGYGPHACVAAKLGRMQLHHAISQICAQMPGLELAGAPERLSSNFVFGVKRMRVAWAPAGSPARGEVTSAAAG